VHLKGKQKTTGDKKAPIRKKKSPGSDSRWKVGQGIGQRGDAIRDIGPTLESAVTPSALVGLAVPTASRKVERDRGPALWKRRVLIKRKAQRGQEFVGSEIKKAKELYAFLLQRVVVGGIKKIGHSGKGKSIQMVCNNGVEVS